MDLRTLENYGTNVLYLAFARRERTAICLSLSLLLPHGKVVRPHTILFGSQSFHRKEEKSNQNMVSLTKVCQKMHSAFRCQQHREAAVWKYFKFCLRKKGLKPRFFPFVCSCSGKPRIFHDIHGQKFGQIYYILVQLKRFLHLFQAAMPIHLVGNDTVHRIEI